MPRLPLLLLALWLAPALAQLSPESAAKNQPVPPFRIAGDLYYVGASDVASYLVVTPAGMILLDGGFAETAPQIERNIATLGFKLTDVKILLNGHAHPDHAGGLAQLKRDSGAAFYAMDKEVQPLEHEGQGTFYRGDRKLYESIQVDRVLHDGDSVSLGGVALTAHRTAGHTPGCTSWSLRVMDGDTPRDALILCQLSLPGNPTLVGDPNYPEIPADFEKSFALLKTLPCEVFLSEHGSVFDLQDKRMRLREGVNPFVDPEGCKRYLAEAEQAFRTELAAEQKSATGKPSLP